MGMIPFADIERHCRADGIDALAVIEPPAELDAAPLERMLADGVGDMDWLEKQREMRLRPTALLPEATRLLCVALPYDPQGDEQELKRARYAAGTDYHGLLRKKLARIGDALDREGRWRWRACVDSAPLNERTLARLAGLGWIGRNGLLISPTAGSYRFLGFLLSDAPLELRRGAHGEDRCGRCTACESRCPTRAIVDRRVLSERCISYLTIEHRGVIPRALAERFEGWWFGCDLCQEVCPWNRFAPAAGDGRLRGCDEERELLAIRADTFDAAFAGRAIRRIGYERFRRNLLVALSSRGRREDALAVAAEGLTLVRDQARELGLLNE
jgi:epoxyqueuosine reductase